jgi:hypothetical protein
MITFMCVKEYNLSVCSYYFHITCVGGGILAVFVKGHQTECRNGFIMNLVIDSLGLRNVVAVD